MARATSRPGTYNDDLLDDGVIVPKGETSAEQPVQDESYMLETYEVRLERLRAEIQLGIDDYKAGRGKVYESAAELYADIMSMAEDDEEDAQEIAGGNAARPS